MKVKFTLTLIAAALSTVMASQAHAGLLGSTVTTQYYAYGEPYNSTGSPDTFVANGTPQSTFAGYYDLTVSDTQISYEFLHDVTWSSSQVSLNSGGLYITNGNLLTFAGAPAINSLSLDGASTAVAGFGISNFTYTTGAVAVDWQNITFHQGDKVILNVSAVPEPETYALFLAGLGILTSVARRRQKSV